MACAPAAGRRGGLDEPGNDDRNVDFWMVGGSGRHVMGRSAHHPPAPSSCRAGTSGENRKSQRITRHCPLNAPCSPKKSVKKNGRLESRRPLYVSEVQASAVTRFCRARRDIMFSTSIAAENAIAA